MNRWVQTRMELGSVCFNLEHYERYEHYERCECYERYECYERHLINQLYSSLAQLIATFKRFLLVEQLVQPN